MESFVDQIFPDFLLEMDSSESECNELDHIDPSIFDEPFVEEISEFELQQAIVAEMQAPVQNDLEIASEEQPAKRFKSLTEKDLKFVDENRFSESTKKNSLWGYNTFREWCLEKSITVDLAKIEPQELADKLSIFYAEVAPKPTKSRNKLPIAQVNEYHKNSLKNIRAALNRYLQVELGRSFNIVKGIEFKKANDMLSGKLKMNVKQGLSRPTQHKNVISSNDMSAIYRYLMQDNPITLRYRVWVDLSVHFVTRGLEFHSQLTPKSFKFEKDETGAEYVTLTHETTQKNHQGDLTATAENSDKRMYETKNKQCPVASLKFFISKQAPQSKHLFCHVEKHAMESPDQNYTWYTNKNVGQRQFSNFMPDISRHAGLATRYTNHCLRSTALTAMTDANIPTRHIMSLSDHTNEMSLVPYARPSTQHKKEMSNVLSNISLNVEDKVVAKFADVNVANEVSRAEPQEATTMNSMMNGFITSSTCSFSNCTFQFTK